MMNLSIFGLIPFCVMGVTDEARSLFPTKDKSNQHSKRGFRVFRPSVPSIRTNGRDPKAAEKAATALPVEDGESEGLLSQKASIIQEPIREPYNGHPEYGLHYFNDEQAFDARGLLQNGGEFDGGEGVAQRALEPRERYEAMVPSEGEFVSPTWNPHQITVRFDYQSGPETTLEKTVEIPQIEWDKFTGEHLVKKLYPGEAFVKDLYILTMGLDHDRFKHNIFFNSDRLQLDKTLTEQGVRPNQILHGMIQPKDVKPFRKLIRLLEATKKSTKIGERIKILREIREGIDRLSRKSRIRPGVWKSYLRGSDGECNVRLTVDWPWPKKE